MTHTSTEQPEALRLAEFFESMQKSSHRWYDGTPVHEKAAAELRRLHARVQELEAAQVQRVPLSVENLEDWKRRVNTLATCSLKADRYRVGAALKQDIADAIHGITQEKQG